MALYDYRCQDCKHTFEVRHGIKELGPEKCPKCGKRNVEKVFLKAPAFHTFYSPMHPRRNRGVGNT